MARMSIYSLALSAAMLCSACRTAQTGGNSMAGISTGAAIGNVLGSAVGGLIGDSNAGWHGAYRGSNIGSILGTVAGATLGYAVTTPKRKKNYTDEGEARHAPQTRAAQPISPYSPLEHLRIENVQFFSNSQEQVIRPEEVYKISFQILNQGSETAHAVIPKVQEVSGQKRFHISPSLQVDEIGPNNGIRYTATLRTGRKVKAGEAVFRVAVTDASEREYDWLEFAIPTEK